MNKTYERTLTLSEVKYGYIAIYDEDSRKQILKWEPIKVKIKEDEYSAGLDKRLGWFRKCFLESIIFKLVIRFFF